VIVGILQSSYMPWVGFFDMLDRVDVFVFHNDLQYDKSWRNRNRIRTAGGDGWGWLTVPVGLDSGFRTQLDRVRVSYDQPWNRRHWNLIKSHYLKAPFFKSWSEPYREILMDRKWELLVELNSAVVAVAMEQLGIECRMVYSESLNLGATAKNERIVAICDGLGADTWMANSACRDYVDPGVYQQAGVTVVYQDYEHPVYSQRHQPFISHLSFLDLIFNHGPDSLAIIRNQRIVRSNTL
jgi:hypothetical protein